MAYRTLGNTINDMDSIMRFVARVVVPLFFLGMAGSVVVIVVSFVEDLKELLGDED